MWVNYAINCDYDSAGLALHLDRGDPARAFMPPSRLLFGPVVAGAGWLFRLVVPGLPFILVWMTLLVVVIAATCVIVFLICRRLTSNVLAAVVGTAMFALSGSTTYLARVLEDNLLTTLLLAIVLLALVPTRARPATTRDSSASAQSTATDTNRQLIRFAAAGVAWGFAVLLGFAAVSWLSVVAIAAWLSASTWAARLKHLSIAAAAGAWPVMLVAAFITPPWQEAPVNPVSRFADGVPNAAMFGADHAMSVRARYVALGVYQSIFVRPSRVGSEWSAAYGDIAAGRHPGVVRHSAVTIFVVLICAAAARQHRSRDDPRLRYGAMCGISALFLTALNLSAIDGSFPERFDHLPLLLAPVMALAASPQRRPLLRSAAFGVVAVMVLVTVSYANLVVSRDSTMWQFGEPRALARLRAPAEPVVFLADIGGNLDMDPLSLGIGLWLGRTNTYLIPTRPGNYYWFYAVPPRSELQDAATRNAWLSRLLSESKSMLLNDAAARQLGAAMSSRGWEIAPIRVGRALYWRASPAGAGPGPSRQASGG